MFEKTKQYLEKLELPPEDCYNLPTSLQRFPDGAHFRIEVPTINSAEVLRILLETASDLGVTINRVDETYGIMRHTDRELIEFLEIAKEYRVELNLSVGPRATYDTSATAKTPQGVRIGYRLRGMNQILRATEDVKRATELGVRGILVYDEGHLWLLNQMRKDEVIPRNTRFKLSAHCGHGNPVAFKVLEMLGADSINPVRDLELPMIAALRQAVKVPLDVHTDNPPGSGGFIRTYEAPELVRIGAPIHLKAGNSALSAHGVATTKSEAVKMAEQASLVGQAVKKYYPEAMQSKNSAPDLAIPE